MTAAAVDNKGYSNYTFPETLDASGNTTSWVSCEGFTKHTIAITVPSATASKFKVEGSLDGTSFFGIDPSGNGDPANSGAIQYSALGTYAITLKDAPLNYIRLNLMSYSGGSTAAGVTAKYRGG